MWLLAYYHWLQLRSDAAVDLSRDTYIRAALETLTKAGAEAVDVNQYGEGMTAEAAFGYEYAVKEDQCREEWQAVRNH